MEEKKWEKIRKIILKVIGLHEKKQQERGEDIKQEIIKEMVELRKETRRLEEVRKNLEKRIQTL